MARPRRLIGSEAAAPPPPLPRSRQRYRRRRRRRAASDDAQRRRHAVARCGAAAAAATAAAAAVAVAVGRIARARGSACIPAATATAAASRCCRSARQQRVASGAAAPPLVPPPPPQWVTRRRRAPEAPASRWHVDALQPGRGGDGPPPRRGRPHAHETPSDDAAGAGDAATSSYHMCTGDGGGVTGGGGGLGESEWERGGRLRKWCGLCCCFFCFVCFSMTFPKAVLYCLLSSQFWPIQSMSRRVINSAKLCLSHPFSRIKCIGQWAVDPHPVLTSTTPAKIRKTAIGLSKWTGQERRTLTRRPRYHAHTWFGFLISSKRVVRKAALYPARMLNFHS